LRSRNIRYWRDKQGNEVDFIIERRGLPPVALEAKWKNRDFDCRGLKAFLRFYPNSTAFVACSDLKKNETRDVNGTKVIFGGLAEVIKHIQV